jgi:hypothetical protein
MDRLTKIQNVMLCTTTFKMEWSILRTEEKGEWKKINKKKSPKFRG